MFHFPFTTFHELNLDWILSVVKAAQEIFENGQEAIDHAVSTSEQALTVAEQAAAATIADGSVTTPKLANEAVTTIKMAPYSVTSLRLAEGAVQISKLADDVKNHIISGSSTAIPAPGSSISIPLDGLTANHIVIYWGFSASPENSPPCDIVIIPSANAYTITNNGGTTTETITPVFMLPLK